MAEAPTNPPQRKTALGAVIGIAVLLLFIGAALYLSSNGFKNSIRDKVVAELERVTGGRVELRRFRWNLSKLEFDADDLTIHGLEPADAIPYAHLDHMKVRVKIYSLLSKQFGLRELIIDRPVLHIIVNKDGTTNQPTPKIKQQSNRDPVDVLFDLAIGQLDVNNGVLLWNDQKTPLDFSAQNVAVQMTYTLLQRRYEGIISIGSSTATYKDFKPLAANAELRFSMTPQGIEVRSLKWASAGSRIEASGRIQDLHNPRIELTYNASLDAAEVGAVTRMPELRRGRFDLNGSGNLGTNGTFTSTGRLLLHDFEYRSASTRLAGVEGSSQFSIDQDKLALNNLFLRLFGGTVRGTGLIRNYAAPPGATSEQQMQHGSFALQLAGVQVRSLAAALSTRSLPLEKINPEGVASGKVGLTWRGSPSNADAQLALQVSPPAHSKDGGLPITADIRGTYRVSTGALALTQLNIATPGAHITAVGGLGSGNSQLKVSFETRNLNELKPLLSAVGASPPPIDLKGKAAFNGVISGSLKASAVRGRVQISDFDTLIPLGSVSPGSMSPGSVSPGSVSPRSSAAPPTSAPPTSAPPTGAPKARNVSSFAALPEAVKRVHWDSLVADVQYSPRGVSVQNGVLQRGAAQITFAGDTALTQGKFTDFNLFHARLSVSNATLQDIQSIAGTDYPVTGTVNATADVSGTMKDLHGDGKVKLAEGAAYGEPYKFLRTDVHFAGQEAQLNNLVFSQNGAQVTGTAAYNLTAKSFRFDLRGNNIELAHLQKLQTPRFTLAGAATFHATGSGTVAQPIINANLRVQGLTMNGEKMGDLAADANTQGRELQLKVRSNFAGAELSADGHAQLAGTFPGDISLKMQHVDFDPLLHMFVPAAQISGHSAINGTVRVTGPLKDWKALTIAANFDEVSAEVQKIAIRSDGPIVIRVQNQVVTLERFHVKGDGTDLNASGTAQLAGARILDIRADGRANLKLLQSVMPDVLAYGFTSLAMTVGGTMNRPALSGTVKIEKAGVSFVDLPNGLADINGTMVLTEDRLMIQTLTAKTGGGGLNLGGYVQYKNGLFFDLTADGREIRLRYPPGISALANTELRFSGTPQRSLLSGDVVVTRFGVNPRFDFALYLARSKVPPTAPKPNTMLDNMRLDVRVTTTPELTVETSLAKISGDADLRIRGTGTRPAVLGRVNVSEGDIFFNGTKYRLERGDVTFTNPVRIEPVLNMEASARVREYDITIGFHGSVDKLSTTYRSEPPLPSADIIALLALGRTREDAVLNQSQQPSSSFVDTASNAVLGEALNAAISSRVQKIFGVSRIKIDPQVGGPENNPNARVTVEQQVNNNITLTFITNLAQSAQQVIQLEYNVTRDISIVALRDQYGVVGFDIRVRQRKR